MTRFVLGRGIFLKSISFIVILSHLFCITKADATEPVYCDDIITGQPKNGIQLGSIAFHTYGPTFHMFTHVRSPVFNSKDELVSYLGQYFNHYNNTTTSDVTFQFNGEISISDWCCGSPAPPSSGDPTTSDYIYATLTTIHPEPSDFRACQYDQTPGPGYTEQCEDKIWPNGDVTKLITSTTHFGYIGYSKIALKCPAGYEQLNYNLGSCKLIDSNLQNCPTKTKPSKNSGPKNCEGNPCNVGTGNKHQSEIDYNGTGAFPLDFIRYYDSNTSPIEPFGPLDQTFSTRYHNPGNGWNSNFSRNIVFPESEGHALLWLLTNQEFQYLYVGRPDKSIVRFNRETLEKVDKDLPGVLLRPDEDTWQFINENNEIETYDATGRLQSIKYQGLTTDVIYNSQTSNNIKEIVGPFGKKLRFFYASGGYLEKMIDPAGNEYHYETSGHPNYRLEKVTYPDETPGDDTDNPYREYLNAGPIYESYLTGIRNENGDIYASWGYDQWRADSSEHAGGVDRIDINYVDDTQRIVTNPKGLERTYHFSVNNNAARSSSVTQKACVTCPTYTKSMTYDTYGYPNEATDFNGNVTDYDFNDRGVEIQRIEAKGTIDERTITTQWHPLFYLPTLISEPGQQMVYDYDIEGRILFERIVDTNNNETRETDYAYYEASDFGGDDTDPRIGLLKTIDGPRTNVTDKTTFEYNLEGEVNRIINAENHVTVINSHDAHGRPLQITDANGTVTTLTYTPRGWLDTQTFDGKLTDYEYYDTGDIKKITLPDNSFLSFGYDTAQRLISIEDNLGNRIEHDLDVLSNMEGYEIKDSSNNIHYEFTRIYDGLSQLKEQTLGAGQYSTYDYDGNSQLTSFIQDPTGLNQITSRAYDFLNRLKKVTDARLGETDFAYDDRDNLHQITDAIDRTTTYHHDGRDDQHLKQSPVTDDDNYLYDNAGNLTQKTDARGIVSTYGYDALNRLNSIQYPDVSGTANPKNVTLTYDTCLNGKGRLCQVDDETGSSSYLYDARGNITDQTVTLDSNPAKLMQYAYDDADRITQITYGSGLVVDYRRNALGQVDQVTATAPGASTVVLMDNIQYKPFGGITSADFGNGLTQSREYDLDYRLSRLTTSSVLDLEYGYTPADNIDVITNHLDGSRSQSFGYNDLHQLTNATGIYGDIDYDYDLIGNRKSITMNPAPTSGATDKYWYEYGDDNRLAEVRDKTGTVLGQYHYNAENLRTKKIAGGVTSYYYYGLDGKLFSEADGSGTFNKEYIYLNGTPIAIHTNGTLYWIHTDHLGTPQTITDVTNATVWVADYRPFGEATITTNTITNNLRFPGQYYDQETGLHYNWNRYYSTDLGRYITSDPIGLDGGMNTYAYANQNPINYYDEDGLTVVHILRAIGTAVVSSVIKFCKSAGKTNKKSNNNSDNTREDDLEDYQNWWTKRNPEQSSPYDIRKRKSTRDGKDTFTTYDKYGRRHREYKFDDADHGPHQHDYDNFNPGSPSGNRSSAKPIDE